MNIYVEALTIYIYLGIERDKETVKPQFILINIYGLSYNSFITRCDLMDFSVSFLEADLQRDGESYLKWI